MNTNTAQLHDINEAIVRKGAEALARILTNERKARDDWYAVGAGLMVGRELAPKDRDFSAWCRENGYVMDARERSEAVWMLKHREDVEAFLSSNNWKSNLAHPTAVHAKCRKHCEWVRSGRTPRQPKVKAEDEVKTLSETAQHKVERLAKALADGIAQAEIKVAKEKMAAEYRARMQPEINHFNEEIERYKRLSKPFKAWLTDEEFKLILGCLHPDREALAERKAKAFDIFNKMKQRALAQ